MARKMFLAVFLLLVCCAGVYADTTTNTTDTTPPSSGTQTLRERLQYERELRQQCRESGDWSAYWSYFQSRHPGILLHDTPVAVSPEARAYKERLANSATNTTDTGGNKDNTPGGIGEGKDGQQEAGETSFHDRLQAANQEFRQAMRALNEAWRKETQEFMEKLKALDKTDKEGRSALIQAFMASLQERKEDVQELITGHSETVQAIFAEYKAGMADKVAEGAEQAKEAKQKALDAFNQRHNLTTDGKVKTTGKIGGTNGTEKVKDK